MAGLLEQFNAAKAEVTRLTGIESTLRAQLAQVPNGDLGALLSEHAAQSGTITRLTGELESANTRATAAAAEVTTLRTQLDASRGDSAVEERAETRAAEIVAGTGVDPAVADTAAANLTGGKSAAQRSYQEHWDHYATLGTAEKAPYYRANTAAMDARR